MLLANEAVATRLISLRRPAIHRVHEEPAELRLREYRDEVLSHDIPCGNLRQRTEIQRLLHRLSALPVGAALKIGFLRSLMRARYAVEPLGHYGLAKAKYTHFTSPIRRYADLVVHRALFDPASAPASGLRDIADHLSATERRSSDAERDSRDVKLFAYLERQLSSGHPDPYPALVTELRNFGFFVDVPGLGMSGAVPLSTLEEDFFQLDTAGNRLVGRRTRRIIRMGDAVTVEVAKVDRFKKQVDFRLVAGLSAGERHPERRKTGRPPRGGAPHRKEARRSKGAAEAKPGTAIAPLPGDRGARKSGRPWERRRAPGQGGGRGPDGGVSAGQVRRARPGRPGPGRPDAAPSTPEGRAGGQHEVGPESVAQGRPRPRWRGGRGRRASDRAAERRPASRGGGGPR